MKGRAIIPILILLILNGCNEPGPVSFTESTAQIEPESLLSKFKKKSLLWEHKGISVNASGQSFVYNDLYVYHNPIFRTGVEIYFTGWTDADTTSYISLLTIQNNGETIFMESGGLYINGNHVLYLNNIEPGNLRFYISLWCDDIECNSKAGLEISKIKLYMN